MRSDRTPGGSASPVGLVLGLLAGLLVVAVTVPHVQPEEARTQGASGQDGFSVMVDGSGARSGDDTDEEAVGGSATDDEGTSDPAGAVATADGSAPEPDATARTRHDGTGDDSSRSAAPAGSVRGVSSESITIGIAYPDLGALRALGPEFDNGDVPEQWRALIDGYRRAGRLPVAGRDIKLVFRDYNVLAPEEQRAACIGLVKDDEAFMVIAQTYYLVGAECVAREFRTPLLTSDGPSDPIFERSAPFLFSLQMSEDRVLRNLVHWADRRGLLDGKQIGIYYEDTPLYSDQMKRTVKAELASLGHDLAAEVTTNQSLGGPQDAVAVQRFRTAGVDVALLFTSKAGFMQQAQAQAYRPTYLESDFLFGTSDSATSTYPPEQFDGAIALTGRRVGETAARIPLGAEGDVCLANYKRYAGELPAVDSAEWAYILTGCDLGKALLLALDASGSDLTASRLVSGLETMRSVPMTRYAPVTFTPDKHHGVDTYRELRWKSDCECWVAAGPFRPLPAR